MTPTPERSQTTELAETEPRKTVRMPQGERLAMILDAARRMLAERNYNDVSIAEIAAECGIVEGSVYRFFKTKRDLMLRVAEDWMEQEYRIGSAYANLNGTRERIHYLIHAAVRTTYDFPGLTRFVLTEVRPDPAYRQTRIYELNRTYSTAIRDVTQAAIASGEFRDSIQARLIRSVVFGAIEHETWRHLRGEGDVSVAEVARELTELVYEGMRNRDYVAATELPVVSRIEQLERRLEKLETTIASSVQD